MNFVLKMVLTVLAAGVWGFFAQTIIGIPAVTGIGAVIIGFIIFGLGERSDDSSHKLYFPNSLSILNLSIKFRDLLATYL